MSKENRFLPDAFYDLLDKKLKPQAKDVLPFAKILEDADLLTRLSALGVGSIPLGEFPAKDNNEITLTVYLRPDTRNYDLASHEQFSAGFGKFHTGTDYGIGPLKVTEICREKLGYVPTEQQLRKNMIEYFAAGLFGKSKPSSPTKKSRA